MKIQKHPCVFFFSIFISLFSYKISIMFQLYIFQIPKFIKKFFHGKTYLQFYKTINMYIFINLLINLRIFSV